MPSVPSDVRRAATNSQRTVPSAAVTLNEWKRKEPGLPSPVPFVWDLKRKMLATGVKSPPFIVPPSKPQMSVARVA